jgi:RNA polymerase sigma-70 factor (ECF subfamily)
MLDFRFSREGAKVTASDESVWGVLIERAQRGDRAALDEMLARASSRLETLARKMLRDYPTVRRWEQTGDVLQDALLRLDRALRQAPPNDTRHFLRLAALQIRRTLIDLARKHDGPRGIAARYESAYISPGGEGDELERFVDASEPASLEAWTAFHEAVERLPDDEREVFQLIWYHGMTQVEAAGILGVNDRSVRRRWVASRVSLGRMLSDDLPRDGES